jgi:biopolymer transport protein TolR
MAGTKQFLRPRGHRRQQHLLSEINVTPMVDVMLVLLIIFMVTGQMLVSGTEVDLPDVRAEQLAAGAEPIEVSLDAQQNIYLGGTLLPPEAFADAITQLALVSETPATQMVIVRADQSLAYGSVMEIVSQIAQSGFTKVAFVSVSPVGPAAAAVP